MTRVAADPTGPGLIFVQIFIFRDNPLKYTDPDGRDVIPAAGKLVLSSINFMYERSSTFKENMNNITKSKNALGERLVVVITALPGETAGLTQSVTGTAERSAKTLTLNENGEIAYGEISIGEKVQEITINIDLNRIDKKNIPILEVVCEEIMHASDAANMGSDAFNEAVIEGQKSFSYYNQPLEVSAKERTLKVLDELTKYNQEH
jgi:hypothetical protein